MTLSLFLEGQRLRFALWRERAENRFSVAWAIQSAYEEQRLMDELRRLAVELGYVGRVG